MEAIHQIDVAPEMVHIDIQQLAGRLEIGLSKLVSLLTELEQRDKIILEIETTIHPQSGEQLYTGSVRLMESPLDEEINITDKS